MSTFGDSQVRKLFIASTAASATAADLSALGEGEVQAFKVGGVGTPAAGEPFVIATKRDGEITLSEVIEPAKYLSFKSTDFAINAPVWTSVFSGTPTSASGKVVDMVLSIENYGANNSSSEPYYMHASHTIESGDTLADIVDGLAVNGNMVANKTGIPVTFASNGTNTVTLTTNRTPYKLGKLAGEPINGKLVVKLQDTDLSVSVTESTNTLINGVEISNLEWSAKGNTGDIYRGAGYPNNIDTDYYADITVDYDVAELAYYSERISAPGDKQRATITIAFPHADASDADTQIVSPINTALGL